MSGTITDSISLAAVSDRTLASPPMTHGSIMSIGSSAYPLSPSLLPTTSPLHSTPKGTTPVVATPPLTICDVQLERVSDDMDSPTEAELSCWAAEAAIALGALPLLHP